MHIAHTDLEMQRQPFAKPFAFKGTVFHEKWNLVVRLRDENDLEAIGVGGTAVLWSDPDIFSAHTEVGGNILMTALLEYALLYIQGKNYPNPQAMLADLLPHVHDYGKTITQNPNLRLTFTLIALVALDNAAWMLYAKQNNIQNFDDLIPEPYRPHFSARQTHIALAPAVGYNMSIEQLKSILDTGVHILKIKIGQPGTETEMVEKDKAWLDRIHEIARTYETSMTDSGRVLYYLDANTRYTRKDSIAQLLDHTQKTGAHEHVILIEEPFNDPRDISVADLPACFAADESVQTTEDVTTRIEQGYGAMAVKPAGKTLSMAFDLVRIASQAGLPCFVADNGCIPLLVEWNKNIAARLPSFPGIKGTLIESNGPENYANWSAMLADYPVPGASWLTPQSGAFVLDDDYYHQSGGIFHDPVPYTNLFR
ncbi:MAG: L-alanine-DL-glutamate epimerase [bacterium]|nr:L-alanine-DL-glutamate epimerase [bacterium]